MAKKSAKIQHHFATLTDPQRRPPVYPLINIVTIAICAVICGADDFVAIAEFGKARRAWFSRFLDLKEGVPSHDRFNAIFATINPAEFEKCLLSWVTALHEISGGQVIAIDGKTLRRSYDTASGKAAIHMVSAWATANSISLGQVVTDAKSNEITAIPKLLEIIDISGALVTIDAMGCQTKIAQKILDGKGNYVLHVKENQPTLYQAIAGLLHQPPGERLRRNDLPFLSDRGQGARSGGDTLLLSLSAPSRLGRCGALAWLEGHRDGHQHHPARWQGMH